MTRAERLDRLEALLRARGSATAEALAAELGVSARTLYRDVAALRARHAIVSGDPGPGGGLRIEARSAMTHVRFREAEVVALWVAAEVARRTLALPWGKDADAGLDRILAALPEPRRRALRAMMRRVAVVPMGAPAPPIPPALLGVFEQAFGADVAIAFDYVDRHGARTRRLVEPHGLLVSPPVWYVAAVDVDKRAPRLFRADRVARPRVVVEHAFTPSPELVQAARSLEAWDAFVGSAHRA